MEFDHNGMIYFALKEESGQVVHISEMVEKDRGKACECICLCCGRPLVAKLGRGKRTAHFAHLAEEGRTTCLADVANESGLHKIAKGIVCNGVQREHNKKLNNGLPILHKVPPKRDYGRYFCIMAEKGGTSHGGLTEKLSLFFHAKKQEVNAYGR